MPCDVCLTVICILGTIELIEGPRIYQVSCLRSRCVLEMDVCIVKLEMHVL